MSRLNKLATLASKMMLTAEQAVALPVVIEKAYKSTNMTEMQMIDTCFANGALRDYLASICRTVTR